MSQIVTWEYYDSLFEKNKQKVSNEDFAKAELQAEKEVCAVIGPIHWGEITEETFGYEQLKDCICNVINKMTEQDSSGAGKGISSASNDGYSESYVIQTESQAREELHKYIRKSLQGTAIVRAY